MTEKVTTGIHQWQLSRASTCSTHHILPDGAMYSTRFDEVLPFHSPGLAPVKKDGKWFHIRPDGTPVYEQRYTRTFGFYEGRAAVQMGDEWFHILDDGTPAYQGRFSWCGNFQNGLCPVRDENNCYYHILPDGGDAYPERYRYAGDFREGSAVVRMRDGMCTHIDENGRRIHQQTYPDLDIFHKGFARACDESGCFHIDRAGTPIYQKRFEEIEPFYNGQALCKDIIGRVIIIDENGAEVMEIKPVSTPPIKKGPKIMIIGTLGAGKTMFAEYTSKKMEIPFTGIDDCRRQLGDGTFAGEYRAWARFIEICSAPEASILEFSGGGPHVYAVRSALVQSGMPIYVIWLNPALDICIQRASNRIQDVPAPYIWGNISTSTPQIHRGVGRAWMNEWTMRPEIHSLRLEMVSEMTLDEQFNSLMDLIGDDDA